MVAWSSVAAAAAAAATVDRQTAAGLAEVAAADVAACPAGRRTRDWPSDE